MPFDSCTYPASPNDIGNTRRTTLPIVCALICLATALPGWSPDKLECVEGESRSSFQTFAEWQFVTIAELGHVAPAYSLSELHSRMKWEVGVRAPDAGQERRVARRPGVLQ
jgi:hypothetical protein